MQKFCQMVLFCFGLVLVVGCGPSKPETLSPEKLKESEAKMEADMKAMTLPKNPAGKK